MKNKKNPDTLSENRELVQPTIDNLPERVEEFYDWIAEQRLDSDSKYSSAERWGIALCYYQYRKMVLGLDDWIMETLFKNSSDETIWAHPHSDKYPFENALVTDIDVVFENFEKGNKAFAYLILSDYRTNTHVKIKAISHKKIELTYLNKI